MQLSVQKQPSVLHDEAYRKYQNAQNEVIYFSRNHGLHLITAFPVHRSQV